MKYKLIPIVKIDSYDTEEVVYDLSVKDDKSYCVTTNNVVVHNSHCKTREVTGVGVWQLEAIISCSDVAHGLGAQVISDGGIRTSGDLCKAFGGGADFCMLGGMFSGTDQCEGEWDEEIEWHKTKDGIPTTNGGKVKKFLKTYGMASAEAQIKHYGGLADYKASEGICTKVPYKGNVRDILLQLQGGLRSSMSYIGTNNIKNFSKCTTFIVR